MFRLLAGSVVLLAVPSLGQKTADSATQPATASRPAVQVSVDTTDAPDAAEWAQQAKRLVEEWYPRVAELLASDGYTPPGEVKLVFKPRMRGPAGTSGTTITISADWIKAHPEDTGMVIHEMTHVVQSYPHYDRSTGWLVEGIADYIRCFHFEPNAPRPQIEPAQHSYRDGYKISAMFLAWIERTQDKAIIRKLNAALRRSEYRYGLFKEWTSKSLDRLWADFADEEAAKQ